MGAVSQARRTRYFPEFSKFYLPIPNPERSLKSNTLREKLPASVGDHFQFISVNGF